MCVQNEETKRCSIVEVMAQSTSDSPSTWKLVQIHTCCSYCSYNRWKLVVRTTDSRAIKCTTFCGLDLEDPKGEFALYSTQKV